ncbi:MAG: bifunctional oligoribonuclease/PAP phosphatase NrnA, partial [Desulfobacterales bacterium]|nr:bifunctional oligoribonuclease/PAP phosphatase NrnA [Desulfobacterales bacterium]
MDELLLCLKKSRRVLLVSHTNPDGDAIGSLVALGVALKRLGKEAVLYNETPIPAVYRFLPLVDQVVRRIEDFAQFDTAVILDCGNLERVGEAAEQVSKLPVILNIDHHVTNTGFGHHRIVDETACATAEILFRLIQRLGVEMDASIAAAIYTGILTDTGSFRFSNTNQAAFAICEKMVGLGVDPYRVAKQVYGTYSLGRIKLLNLALDSIELAPNGKLSMMVLTRDMLEETGTRPEDSDGLINYARSIEDVKVAALIQENENGVPKTGHGHRYHVSLRSDGSVDVARFAAVYGGGGH